MAQAVDGTVRSSIISMAIWAAPRRTGRRADRPVRRSQKRRSQERVDAGMRIVLLSRQWPALYWPRRADRTPGRYRAGETAPVRDLIGCISTSVRTGIYFASEFLAGAGLV